MMKTKKNFIWTLFQYNFMNQPGAVEAQGLSCWLTDQTVECSNSSTAELPLLCPWTWRLTLNYVNEINLNLDKGVCQMKSIWCKQLITSCAKVSVFTDIPNHCSVYINMLLLYKATSLAPCIYFHPIPFFVGPGSQNNKIYATTQSALHESSKITLFQ